MDKEKNGQELQEKLVQLNRVAKVVKGGRRFSFNALMVVGDKHGHVGVGFGKANEVPESIRKGVENAKKQLINVKLTTKRTIPHEIIGKYGSSKVWLKPASPGTGIIAGGPVRAVIEYAGVHDILSKSYGSRNPLNVVKATINALENLKDYQAEAMKKGKKISEIFK